MKKLLFSMILLGIAGLPRIAAALVFIPTANITIITNTTPPDGVFNYHLSQGATNTSGWQTSTVNGVGVYSLSFLPAHPDNYVINQELSNGQSLTIDCSSQNHNSVINIGQSQVAISLHVEDSVTCIFSNFLTVEQDELLLIPGIMGTEMWKGGELVWPDITRMLYTNNDRFMDPLSYTSAEQPLDFSVNKGEVILNPNRLYNYSEKLISDLTNHSYTVETFPYDWRKDIRELALQDLKQKIDALIPEGSDKKIDIVAHSQGGLLIKYLLYKKPEYQSRIGKLIFLGTPHLGAPKPVKALLYGDAMGVDLLGLGLDPQEIKRIGQNMPSVYELMPSKEYFNHTLAGYLGTTEKVAAGVEKVNIYDYNKTKQVLKEKGLNSGLIDSAEAFHEEGFDNFDFSNTSIDTYNIVGCQDATIGRIFTRSNGKYRIEYMPGDGTVPVFSASNVGTGHVYYALETEHGTMFTGDGTREQVLNILDGHTEAVTNKITTNSADCHFAGEQVSVHSPVDLHIYDESGNHVGPSLNGGFDYQIPHVQYDVLGDEKFAFLPQGHSYRLELPATNSGTFDLYTEKIEEGTLTSSAYYHSVPITAQSKAFVNLNIANNQVLKLDTNGDGSVDSSVSPTSILGPQQLADVLSPVTKAVVVGPQGHAGWYRSNTIITLTSNDIAQDGTTAAGVLETKYSIDGNMYSKYELPISFATEGVHSIKFYSTDKAGNSEAEQEVIFTIDKTAPEAVVGFSGGSKDLVVTGVDELDPAPAVVDQGGIVKITDKAGNITTLGFTEKDRKKKLKAGLVSLSYNGALQDISKNKFSYIWDYDKNSNLKKLEQQAKSKKDFNISADFNGTATKVEAKDTAGKIKHTYPALKLLQIKTNKGDLDWSLF